MVAQVFKLSYNSGDYLGVWSDVIYWIWAFPRGSGVVSFFFPNVSVRFLSPSFFTCNCHSRSLFLNIISHHFSVLITNAFVLIEPQFIVISFENKYESASGDRHGLLKTGHSTKTYSASSGCVVGLKSLHSFTFFCQRLQKPMLTQSFYHCTVMDEGF